MTLRDDLVAATERLMLRHGDVDDLSVRVIAAEAGCSPAALYLHFADKDELLLGVCEQHFAELDRLTEAAAADIADPVEALAARGRAYVQFGLANPQVYRLLFMTRTEFDPTARPDLGSMAAFTHMVEAVAAVAEAGRLLVDDDPFTVTTALWAAVHGITSLRLAKPAFPWPPLDQQLGLVIDGLLGALTS